MLYEVITDAVVLQNVLFHIEIFYRRRGGKAHPPACRKEESDHSGEEKNWDEKQDESPKGEAFCHSLKG